MGEITPRTAAVQTADDVQDEFGAETHLDGNKCIIDNSDDDVSPRVVYGYADTTATNYGLSVAYEQPSENQIAIAYSEAAQ